MYLFASVVISYCPIRKPLAFPAERQQRQQQRRWKYAGDSAFTILNTHEYSMYPKLTDHTKNGISELKCVNIGLPSTIAHSVPDSYYQQFCEVTKQRKEQPYIDFITPKDLFTLMIGFALPKCRSPLPIPPTSGFLIPHTNTPPSTEVNKRVSDHTKLTVAVSTEQTMPPNFRAFLYFGSMSAYTRWCHDFQPINQGEFHGML